MNEVITRIPLNVNTLSQQEIESAIRVLKADHLTMGKECELFEREFSAYLGVRHAILVNSGSSANLLACFALSSPLLNSSVQKQPNKRIKSGAEVIVPALTWPTTIWPIIQAGAIPVFVDVDPNTLQMNLNQVEEMIGANTAAIFAVHVLGNATPLNELRALADRYDLWLLEDTCESLGVTYNHQYVGTVGDIGTFSFYFSHHITTIEGGMVVTNDDNIADILRCLRAHGWTRHMQNRKAIEAQYPHIDPRFLFISAGFNVRSTEINAVLGRGQLPKLLQFNKRRNEIADFWLQDLSNLIGKYFTPMQITKNTIPAWFGFPIICNDANMRNNLRNFLEASGVETRPIICGNMLRQPALKEINYKSIKEILPVADKIMNNGLYWGCHPFMSQEDMQYVSEVVKEFFNK